MGQSNFRRPPILTSFKGKISFYIFWWIFDLVFRECLFIAARLGSEMIYCWWSMIHHNNYSYLQRNDLSYKLQQGITQKSQKFIVNKTKQINSLWWSNWGVRNICSWMKLPDLCAEFVVIFTLGDDWLLPGLNWNVFEWFVNIPGCYQSS